MRERTMTKVIFISNSKTGKINNWCQKSEQSFILVRREEGITRKGETGGGNLSTGNFPSLYLGTSYTVFLLCGNKNKHTHTHPSMALHCLPNYIQTSKPAKQDCSQWPAPIYLSNQCSHACFPCSLPHTLGSSYMVATRPLHHSFHLCIT